MTEQFTDPVSFITDIEDERDRWKRDCELAQQRLDEVTRDAEAEANRAALSEFRLTNEVNRLRALLRDVSSAFGEVLETLDKLKTL